MPFRARCNPTCLVRRQNAFFAVKRIYPIASNGRDVGMVQPGGSSYRYNSTSSVFSPFTSFFSRAKGVSPPSPEQAAAEFISSISTLQTDSLSSAYNIIISSPSPAQYLSQEDLYNAMSLLASSRSPGDLNLLRRVYEDLPNLFDYAMNADHQNLFIKALCNNGLVEEAFSFVQSVDPQTVDWRLLLRSASSQHPSLVDLIIPSLQRYSSFDQTDISLIIKSIRNSHSSSNASTTRDKLESLMDEVNKKSIKLDTPTEAELMRLYISLGELDKANEIVSQWKIGNVHSPGLWNAIIELYIARSDINLVEETIGRMREKGYEAPQKALTFLALQNLQSNIDSRSTVGFSEIVGSIENAERICGNSASADVWAELVRLYLSQVKSHESLDVAIDIYNEVLSRGIEVSAELARNIIIPLCNTRSKSPTSTRLNDAIRIYEDYISSPKAFSNYREKTRFSTVYQYLLMLCSKSKSNTNYSIQVSIKLLSDMRNNQITLNPKNLISLLVLLMKSSEDHQSAFNLYAHFYALSPNLIDEQGYKAILTNYLNLSWEKSPYPPPELFIEILKDMNKSGYQPDSHILSSLLKQYGHQATKLRRKARSPSSSHSKTDSMAISTRNDEKDINIEEQIDNLGQSIRDIHTLIKLDPLISVDIPLLGSLMDSYGRVGAFSECFEVWDELVQRRSRENPNELKNLYAASINVILDACGWSYSLKRGKKVWLWCKKFNLIWEKKHYDSYLEFLCRNSQLKDAGLVLFEEMGFENTPEADKESVRIILKFGRKEKDLGKSIEDMVDFVKRLKMEKKDLYDQLQEEGELEGFD